jgi:signal transduction histidine kinase
LFDESGSITGYGSLARDISKQLAMQRQQDSLIESQKLESLGVLAGGIAHNFNNLLFAILGNADLALSRLPADSPARERIEQIELAGTRAAELARDMLAYSGKGAIVVEPVDLPALVEETGRLVTAGTAAGVELGYRFEEGLPPIVADANQIRQVVLSLVTNAAEALGTTGGSIEVRADVVDEIPGDGFRLPEAAPAGPFVRLEVEDHGMGMDSDTLAHLFDPFFTTKFTGRGLGLAAVLGIVRGHGGAIRVTSELGSGTVTTLLFPCAARPLVTAPSHREASAVEID